MKSQMKDWKNIVIAILVIGCLVLAFFVSRKSPGSAAMSKGDQVNGATTTKATIWTCSMHPQIRRSEPGSCPLCGMDLIPASDDSDEGGPWELSLSEYARKLANIQTALVERKPISREIRMVGKIDYDEKRVGDITAWVPGRVDRLFVDYTGIEVRKGDHLVELYSPELVTAQQELRQALGSVKSGPESIKNASKSRLNAVRRKLSLLGLSSNQIKMLESRNSPSDHLTIESPMAGIVIKKHLNEGAYVKIGTPIYTVADLSRVWVILEAYESDISWLRYGQEVQFEVEAYPGEPFSGRIVFIDPTLDPATRTVKIRIDMPNTEAKLKPDMFVRAVAHAMVSPGGKVIDPSIAGKWIGPMHPEIVKDKPGSCDVCGMALVKAEDLGFGTVGKLESPLIIPATAALITGDRAVVYVAIAGKEGSFEGREIILGPEAGDYYIVKSGLAEGERVVVNGAFKIDSELQIRAKFSMMYHPSATDGESDLVILETKPEFRKTLQPVYAAYFRMQTQLSQDELHPSHQAGKDLEKALSAVAIDLLDARGLTQWQGNSQALIQHLNRLSKVGDLEQARTHFGDISNEIYRMAQQFGAGENAVLYRFHCPMAFDNKGADWLQNHTKTSNPYYGSAMFSCGSQVEDVIESRAKAKGPVPPKGGGHDH